MKKRCVVVGASKIKEIDFLEKTIVNSDYVICADGGYDAIRKTCIVPDLLVGDLDSIECDVDKKIDIIKLACEKDDTDMMVAVKEGMLRGFKNFLLLGALGGRLDHTYSNLCLLKYICDCNIKAVMINESTEVFLIPKGTHAELNNKKGKTISVFPFGCELCRVSYEGLKYSMQSENLLIENPIGVSNVIENEKAYIFVHEGLALIFLNLT